MLDGLIAYLWVRFEELKSDEGQGVVEYALLAAFISIVAIVFIQNVGDDVVRLFTKVDGDLNAPAATP